MTQPNKPRPASGNARHLLRGVGGAGAMGTGPFNAGSAGGGPASTPAPAGHSPLGDALQPKKASVQNTRTKTIQARKAPGA